MHGVHFLSYVGVFMPHLNALREAQREYLARVHWRVLASRRQHN